MDLDRPEAYASVDPAGALADVEGAWRQWAGAPRPARMDLTDLTSVVITGVGGSGICADVVAGLAADVLPVPVIVHKTYGLPAHVGPRALVVAVSCSGTTEETISGAEEAVRRGSRLLAITGGGPLARLCDTAGQPHVEVPQRCQPRHSLGALVVPVLSVLGLDSDLDEAVATLREVAVAHGRDVPQSRNPAKQLGARVTATSSAVVQGARPLAAVAAYRLKCQLNENAGLPSFFGELPEVTHNELVGWGEPHALAKGAALVLVRDPASEHPRVAQRIGVMLRLVGDRFASVDELHATGTSPLARLASLLLIADLVSVYAALARDEDPTPITLIDRLKQDMARHDPA